MAYIKGASGTLLDPILKTFGLVPKKGHDLQVQLGMGMISRVLHSYRCLAWIDFSSGPFPSSLTRKMFMVVSMMMVIICIL